MATEDARYRQSTQYRLWSFSRSQLAELRTTTNDYAAASISDRLSASSTTTSASTPAVSASNTPNHHQSSSAAAAAAPPSSESKPALPDFLTPGEEAQLLKFYTVELLRAAAFCELPVDIQATAAVFLRRFYLTNSIMTYPPTDMLKTALFFGSKAEGYYTRLKK